MQYDISDEAALTLAQTFYETLAENLPIETALAEARKAISLGVEESAEWGTPVFYTHAPDSVLFDVPRTLLADEPATPLPVNGDKTEAVTQPETANQAVADAVDPLI